MSAGDELVDHFLHRILIWQLVDIEVPYRVVGRRWPEHDALNIAAALDQALANVNVLLQLLLLFGKLLLVIETIGHSGTYIISKLGILSTVRLLRRPHLIIDHIVVWVRVVSPQVILLVKYPLAVAICGELSLFREIRLFLCRLGAADICLLVVCLRADCSKFGLRSRTLHA